jgi:hypothetical protein
VVRAYYIIAHGKVSRVNKRLPDCAGMFRPEVLGPLGLPPRVRVLAWGLSLERYCRAGQPCMHACTRLDGATWARHAICA